MQGDRHLLSIRCSPNLLYLILANGCVLHRMVTGANMHHALTVIFQAFKECARASVALVNVLATISSASSKQAWVGINCYGPINAPYEFL